MGRVQPSNKDQSATDLGALRNAGAPSRPANEASSSRASSRYGKAAGRKSVVRSLQEKAGTLELNLEQVCGELDATRQHLQRVLEDQENSQALQNEAVAFLLACLADVKKGYIPGGGSNNVPEKGGIDAHSGAPSGGSSYGNQSVGAGLSQTSGPQQGGVNASASGVLSGGGSGIVQIDQLTLQQREAVLAYLLSKFRHRYTGQPGSAGTFQTQSSGGAFVGSDSLSRGSSYGLPPIVQNRDQFDDDNLANDFSRLFATPGSTATGGYAASTADGASTDGRSLVANAMIQGKSVQSVGIQTDSAPVTILRSVDVGVRPRGLFTGDGAGNDGYGYSIGAEPPIDETNSAESLTSRLLRGTVRDWGRPAPIYKQTKVGQIGGTKRGSEMYLKKKSGKGGGNK